MSEVPRTAKEMKEDIEEEDNRSCLPAATIRAQPRHLFSASGGTFS